MSTKKTIDYATLSEASALHDALAAYLRAEGFSEEEAEKTVEDALDCAYAYIAGQQAVLAAGFTLDVSQGGDS